MLSYNIRKISNINLKKKGTTKATQQLPDDLSFYWKASSFQYFVKWNLQLYHHTSSPIYHFQVLLSLMHWFTNLSSLKLLLCRSNWHSVFFPLALHKEEPWDNSVCELCVTWGLPFFPRPWKKYPEVRYVKGDIGVSMLTRLFYFISFKGLAPANCSCVCSIFFITIHL